MKHPLARALRGAGLTVTDVAARLAVDPKTVERWLGGRVPYPRHRAAVAQLTGWSLRDLWPETVPSVEAGVGDELRTSYPHRSAVPADAWRVLFNRAQREIGILAYSALFLAEDAAVQTVLRAKASAGVRVRILLGDPNGSQVGRRGADEGIHDVMRARILNTLVLFKPLTEDAPVDLRVHDTALYNSIYRGDDDLLVNPHVYGQPASHAPVLHLRVARADGMAATYLDSFERVWVAAREWVS